MTTATIAENNWHSAYNTATAHAADALEAFLDEANYKVLGCYQHSDTGQVAVVYTDPAEHGAFAVRLADALEAANFESYSEWCNSTHDLADAELATLVADEHGHKLKYSGACTYVLEDVVDADDVLDYVNP